MTFARRLAASAAVAALLATMAASTGEAAPVVSCVGNPSEANPLTLTVQGQQVDGLYAVPAAPATALVVFFHGYGNTVESWRHHIIRTARDEGVVAVAMNYHGEEIIPATEPGGLPSSRGWKVAEGAKDGIAAAKLFLRNCSTLRTVIAYGVSMGGNSSGLAVAARATRSNGKPLFDHWIDVEGAANVIETYHSARQLAPVNAYAANATADIEDEMGGTFEEVPLAYLKRTVVRRVDDIAASGVGVVVVHGVGDGLVPYNQSRELVAALRALGVPTELHTVVTRDEGSESGTTLDGYLPQVGQPPSPFAGHAWEGSETHLVGRLGFLQLHELLQGFEPVCHDHLVDGDSGGELYTPC